MAIITAAGLANPQSTYPFNKNGSVITLKKISETDWLLFGDIAEGDSEGFPMGDSSSFADSLVFFRDNTLYSYEEFIGRGGLVEVTADVDDPENCFFSNGTISIVFPDENYLWVGMQLPTSFSGGRNIHCSAVGSGGKIFVLNRDSLFAYDVSEGSSSFSSTTLPTDSMTKADIGMYYSVDSPGNLLFKPQDGGSFSVSLDIYLDIVEPE